MCRRCVEMRLGHFSRVVYAMSTRTHKVSKQAEQQAEQQTAQQDAQQDEAKQGLTKQLLQKRREAGEKDPAIPSGDVCDSMCVYAHNELDGDCKGSMTKTWYPGYITAHFEREQMEHLAHITAVGVAGDLSKKDDFDKWPICYRPKSMVSQVWGSSTYGEIKTTGDCDGLGGSFVQGELEQHLDTAAAASFLSRDKGHKKETAVRTTDKDDETNSACLRGQLVRAKALNINFFGKNF